MSEKRPDYETDEPFEEHLPGPKFEETGDFAKQTRMEFPHFQGKKVTLFALDLHTDDMRHTIGVQFGDLQTSLNAHDALKMLDWLQSHRGTIALLSQHLDAVAWSDDMADMRQIKQEWYGFRHQGDEHPTFDHDLLS